MKILPWVVPDEATLYDVAREAVASHLHLVIDRDGQAKLTPILLPGMVKIAVLDKSLAEKKAA